MRDFYARIDIREGAEDEDAKRRLARNWCEYAAPYLNSEGELVRWQLVEVLDVYRLLEDEIDPNGTEMYSRIRPRRTKAAPSYVA